MPVYKGEQSFRDWLALCSQGKLFEKPVTDRDRALQRLTVLAGHVTDALGREATWTDLKESLKDRASGRIAYDAALIVAALDAALRERKSPLAKLETRAKYHPLR